MNLYLNRNIVLWTYLVLGNYLLKKRGYIFITIIIFLCAHSACCDEWAECGCLIMGWRGEFFGAAREAEMMLAGNLFETA